MVGDVSEPHQREEGWCEWHLVGEGQAHCSAPYSAQYDATVHNMTAENDSAPDIKGALVRTNDQGGFFLEQEAGK